MAMHPSGLAAHDALLGPVAARHAGTARATALALLCAGLGASTPLRPSVIVAWSSSRLRATRPDVVPLLAGPAARPLIAAARKRVRQTTSPTGRAVLRLRAARRLVGWSLVPGAAGGGVAEIAARRALVVVGSQVLDNLGPDGNGIDSPRVGAPSLAIALGCRPQAAKRALLRAVEEGSLARVGAPRHGVANVYRLAQLHGAAVAVADDYTDLIDTLATDGMGAPAEVLRTTGHPAWGYSTLTGRHWAVLLATAADVDPGDLGVTARVAACRRELDRLGVTLDDLGPSLDRLAAMPDRDGWSTPAMRRDAAEAARREAAAARIAEVARARAEKVESLAAARAVRAIGRSGPTPVDRTGRADRAAPDRRTVALPPWWTGPEDADRLRSELAGRAPGWVLVEVGDGRAVIERAAAA